MGGEGKKVSEWRGEMGAGLLGLCMPVSRATAVLHDIEVNKKSAYMARRIWRRNLTSELEVKGTFCWIERKHLLLRQLHAPFGSQMNGKPQ
jgi:hypothetical protein